MSLQNPSLLEYETALPRLCSFSQSTSGFRASKACIKARTNERAGLLGVLESQYTCDKIWNEHSMASRSSNRPKRKYHGLTAASLTNGSEGGLLFVAVP